MALTKISGSILKDPLNLGEVSIGGTLTYQDVTNVDSVGIITARSTIDAQGDVSIADKIIHTGDTNTTIRFPAADTITAETGGTERLRINSSGLVNIGAGSSASGLSPLLHLHKNASNDSAYLHITNNDTGITNNDGFLIGVNPPGDCLVFNKDSTPIRFATAGVERLRIDAGGGMQLGTSTATASKLTVYGANDAAAIFQGSGTGTGAANGLLVGNNGGTTGLLWNYENGNTLLATNNIERLRIDSSGRVLIGTTTEGNSSADNLTVEDSGESGITVRSGTSNGGHIYFSDATSGSAEYQGLVSYQHGGDFMKFGTAATERLRINSLGNVSIGGADATPSSTAYNGSTLHLYQSGSSSVGSEIKWSTGASGHTASDGAYMALYSDNNMYCNIRESGSWIFYTSNTERLRIESGGDIRFNNTDSIIHTSSNSSRLRLFGGSSNTVNNGAALTLNGVSHSAGNYADLASGSGGHIQFRVGTSEKNRIDSSGLSGNIKNNYALVAFITDRDDGSRSTGSTSYQDDTGLLLTNAITYQHGDILFVRANCPTGVALVSSNTANYQGVGVRIKITPSSGTTRYSNETRGWYRNDGPATKETMQMSTTIYHLIASNTSQFSNNVTLSFQVQYKRDPGGTGSYGAVGLCNWSGERTLEVWQFRKQL